VAALFVSTNQHAANHGFDDLRNASNADPGFRRLLAIRHYVEFGLSEGIVHVEICDQAALLKTVHYLLRIIRQLVPVGPLDRELDRETSGGCERLGGKILDHRTHFGNLV